jgi:hypothetical protein
VGVGRPAVHERLREHCERPDIGGGCVFKGILKKFWGCIRREKLVLGLLTRFNRRGVNTAKLNVQVMRDEDGCGCDGAVGNALGVEVLYRFGQLEKKEGAYRGSEVTNRQAIGE